MDRIEAITEVDRLGDLEDDWRRLAELRGNAFLTPDWCMSWFEHYGEDAAPFVPVLREGGELVGLLPLALSRSGRPRVCWIAGANLGDHFFPLAEIGRETDVAAAVGEALNSAQEAWSILALHHVDLEQPWLASLLDASAMRLRVLTRGAGPLPYIDLSEHAGWEEYLASRSSNFRQSIRARTRRAAKRHAMRLRRTERPDEVRKDMALFLDLHDRRFSGRGSSLRSDRARDFHMDFAAAALRRGWLRLWFLELEGRPAAAWYGWRVGDRYSFFNSGFDPDWSKASPGLVLQAEVIREAFEEGAREFDLLLGDEGYKLRFADRSRTVNDVTAARALPHPAALVTGAERVARAVGRRLPSSIRGRLAGRSLLRGRGR